MKLQIKITSEVQTHNRFLLVDGSMKVTDFVKKHKVSGPFHSSNGKELEYSIVGNETFETMMSDLCKETKESKDSVYFKELSSEELADRSRKEALLKFEADRETKTGELMKRIENVKKVRDEVGKFTSLDDEFLNYFDKVKVENNMISDFDGVKSKKEAIDAIKSLEDALEKVKPASDHKLEIDLKNKCLSLLKSCAPVGIEFKEIGEHGFSKFSASTNEIFYSREHWEEYNRSKLFKKKRLAVGVEGSGGGFGGSGAAAGAVSYGYRNYSGEQINLDQEGATEATQVVVSKQSINQLVKFQAKCAILKSTAEDKARQVARECENGKAEILRDFFKEYPEKINFGPFGVGGRFEIIAVTTSSEKKSVSYLQEIASKRVNDDFRLALSLGTLTGAGSGSGGFQKDSVEAEGKGFAIGHTEIKLNTRTEKFCHGPNVTREDDLNRVLHIDPESWNIFPSPDGCEYHFVPIYEVIEDMAKMKGGDEELVNAAAEMKKFLQKQKEEEDKRKKEEEDKRKKEEEDKRKKEEEDKRKKEEEDKRKKAGKRFMFCSSFLNLSGLIYASLKVFQPGIKLVPFTISEKRKFYYFTLPGYPPLQNNKSFGLTNYTKNYCWELPKISAA